mgnify:CR=1 FL=1
MMKKIIRKKLFYVFLSKNGSENEDEKMFRQLRKKIVDANIEKNKDLKNQKAQLI